MSTTTARTWLSSAAIVLSQSTQAMAIATIALFLTIIREELGLTFGQAGLLAAVATLTYAVMQLPSGVLSERVNPKVLFLIGLFCTNALAILFTMSDDFTFLVVTQALAGIARSFMFIPGLVLMTNRFPESRRSSAMAMLFAGGLSAYVIVNLIAPLVVDSIGWRGFLIVASSWGLGLVILIWVVVPSQKPERRLREAAPREAAVRVWRSPSWWTLGVVQFVRMALMAGFTFWLPAFLVAERGLSLSNAGYVVAGTYAVTALSNLVGSAVSDRWNTPARLSMVALAALAVLLALVGFIENPILLIVCVLLIAVFLQSYFGPLFMLPRRLYGPGNSGVSAGFGNLCANLGGFAAALGLGLVRDAVDSFTVGFLLLSAAAVLALACLVILAVANPAIRDRRRAEEPVGPHLTDPVFAESDDLLDDGTDPPTGPIPARS